MTTFTILSRDSEPTTKTLSYEQALHTEQFQKLCDLLIDKHDFMVAPVFCSMNTELYNEKDTFFDGLYGYGVRRISPLQSNEESGLYVSQACISVELNLDKDTYQTGFIDVVVGFEDRFVGGFNSTSHYSLPLSALNDGSMLEAVATINAIYMKLVLDMADTNESLRIFINRNDFYKPALWQLLQEQLLQEQVSQELAVNPIHFQLQPYNELITETNNEGVETRYIYVEYQGVYSHSDTPDKFTSVVRFELDRYLDKMLQNATKYS